MKNYLQTTILAVMLMLPFTLSAQTETPATEFKVSAELRTKGEYRAGIKKLMLKDELGLLVISQRSRLNFDYTSEKLDVRISFQDARSFGQGTIIARENPSVPALLYEGWAKYKFNAKLGIKMGRVELHYGDARLIGNKGWQNHGASHDVIVAEYENPDHKSVVHIGFASNTSNDFAYNTTLADNYIVNNYKHMAYLWYSNQLTEGIKMNFINLAEGFQKPNTPTTSYVINTIGTNIIFNQNNMLIDAAFYYQAGKDKSSADTKAMNAVLYAGYNFGKITPTIGYEYFSGKAHDDTDGTVKTFNVMHWSGHARLGYMDYFLTIPTGGMTDITARLDYKLNDKANITGHFHNFSLANEMMKGTTVVEKSLGNEIDMEFKYTFGKGMMLAGGYSVMIGTENLENLQGIPADKVGFSQFGWVMLTFKPSLFVYTK